MGESIGGGAEYILTTTTVKEMMVMIPTAVEVLVPSWWEVKVTVAASLFVIFAYWFFSNKTDDLGLDRTSVEIASTQAMGDEEKVNSCDLVRLD